MRTSGVGDAGSAGTVRSNTRLPARHSPTSEIPPQVTPARSFQAQNRLEWTMARAITQIGRYGTNHLANPTPWHRPSRKSGAMAETISQIGRYGRKGASHLRNPTPWHKPSRKSGEMVPWRRICEISAPVRATASDLRDGGARFCHAVGFARWRGPRFCHAVGFARWLRTVRIRLDPKTLSVAQTAKQCGTRCSMHTQRGAHGAACTGRLMPFMLNLMCLREEADETGKRLSSMALRRTMRRKALSLNA